MTPLLCNGAASLALALLFAAPAQAEKLRLTEADSGRSLVLRHGDEVEVRLRENASTGFVWAEQADGAPGLKALGRDTDYPDARYPNVRPGAPGEAIFRYRADVPGEAKLSLRYARPWEKDAPPAQRFSARFDIRP
jgi:inhibitor of cysteine peptidase